MKYPIRLDHYDKKHGNKHFVFGVESVLEYAEELSGVEVHQCGTSWVLCDGKCDTCHINNFTYTKETKNES